MPCIDDESVRLSIHLWGEGTMYERTCERVVGQVDVLQGVDLLAQCRQLLVRKALRVCIKVVQC